MIPNALEKAIIHQNKINEEIMCAIECQECEHQTWTVKLLAIPLTDAMNGPD